jgi:hypothetical protein
MSQNNANLLSVQVIYQTNHITDANDTMPAHIRIGVSPSGVQYNVYTKDKSPIEIERECEKMREVLGRRWRKHNKREIERAEFKEGDKVLKVSQISLRKPQEIVVWVELNGGNEETFGMSYQLAHFEGKTTEYNVKDRLHQVINEAASFRIYMEDYLASYHSDLHKALLNVSNTNNLEKMDVTIQITQIA